MIGAENLAIGVSLFMRDSFTASANRASAAMVGLSNNADNLARSQAVAARNTAASGAAIGVGMLAGVADAYKGAAKFDYLIKYVGLLSDKGGKHFDQIRDKVNDVAKTTTFDPHQIADAMKYMAQSGMQYEGIINSIQASTNLAQATMSDVGGKGGSADWMTSLMQGWGIDKTETNFNHMSDVLAIAVNNSKTTLAEFGEAMTYTMSTAHRMKMGLHDTTAALMMMSNMGLRGSMGGVSISNMLNYASRAAGSKEGSKQANALASMGLSQQDLRNAENGLVPIGSILEKIYRGAATMKGGISGVDAQNSIYAIFGQRGQRAIAISDDMESYNQVLDRLQNQGSKGYASNMAKDMMDSSLGGLDMLADAWITVKNAFGSAIVPLIHPMVKGLTTIFNLIKIVTENPIGRMIASVITGFIMIKTVASAYQAITLTLALMQGRLGTSAATMSATTTTGLQTQTTAANAYAAALGRVAAVQMGVGTGSLGMFASASSKSGFRNSKGQFMAAGAGALGVTSAAVATRNRFGAVGRMAGKASPMLGKYGGIGGMLGGIALGSLSESAGGNKTGLGVGLGVAGDALSGMGTGAMIGSIIPGIGTAVGAVVGGVGMLAYGLYTRMNELNSVVKDANSTVETTDKAGIARLRREYELYSSLKSGQKSWRDNETGGPMRTMDPNVMPMGRSWERVNTNITINMDGRQVMKESYDESDLQQILNLGIR